jgi:hypothetical protein
MFILDLQANIYNKVKRTNHVSGLWGLEHRYFPGVTTSRKSLNIVSDNVYCVWVPFLAYN